MTRSLILSTGASAPWQVPMDTVTDHLQNRVTTGGGGRAGADRARRPVVQGRHTVEDVGCQRGRPARGAKCGPSSLGIADCVADSGHDGVRTQQRRKVRRAWAFGRESHLGDRLGCARSRCSLSQRANRSDVDVAECRGFCAPRRSIDRNGPSRCMPAKSPWAAEAAQVVTPLTSASGVLETRLPTSEVVPPRWW
jgi:hypothetical protein